MITPMTTKSKINHLTLIAPPQPKTQLVLALLATIEHCGPNQPARKDSDSIDAVA